MENVNKEQQNKENTNNETKTEINNNDNKIRIRQSYESLYKLIVESLSTEELELYNQFNNLELYLSHLNRPKIMIGNSSKNLGFRYLKTLSDYEKKHYKACFSNLLKYLDHKKRCDVKHDFDKEKI